MSEDEYEIPLQDQRVFGAGLKRKRIHFVPPSTSLSQITSPQPNTGFTSVGERYLSVVLPSSRDSNFKTTETSPAPAPVEDSPVNEALEPRRCEICSLSIGTTAVQQPHPHEASLVHQVCLQHSHPPSHLDRSRIGLRYLQSQGWDPDSRLGLGAQGQGIQFPIKAKPKDDKLGLGLVLPDEKMRKETKRGVGGKLDAGKVRKLAEKDRRKRDRLQDLFYRSEDLHKYLSSG